ncbi:MAG: hypothetical protein WBL81_22135, partial [Pseudolabrys sp.]
MVVKPAGNGATTIAITFPDPEAKIKVATEIARTVLISLSASAIFAGPHERRSVQKIASLDKLGAKPKKLIVRNRPGLLQLIEFGDFVRHAVANHMTQFLARLLDLLSVALGHSSSLRDQVREDPEIRGEN